MQREAFCVHFGTVGKWGEYEYFATWNVQMPARAAVHTKPHRIRPYTLTVSPALMTTRLPSMSAQTEIAVGLWRVLPSAEVRMARQAFT